MENKCNLDNNIDLQKSVRDNCEEMKNSLLGLSKWEKEIKLKEKEQKKGNQIEEKIQQPPPLRNKPIIIENDNKNREDFSKTADQLKQTANSIKEKYNNILNACPRSVANIEKDKGNECVKCQDYEQGVIFYTKAIDIFNEDPAYFSNRAHCYLKMEKYHECINDCNKSIALDNKFVKSFFRRMKANEILGNIDVAIKDCSYIMMLEPQNASFKKNFTDLMKLKNQASGSTKIMQEKQDDTKEKNQKEVRDWSKTQEVQGKIDFIEKSPAERSKKPLKRIEIKEIIEERTLNIFNNKNEKDDDSDSIPDEIVDQLFNNATGECTRKRSLYGQNYNNRNYSTRTIDQIINQTQSQQLQPIASQFELYKPPPKSICNPTIITYLNNDDDDNAKEKTTIDIKTLMDNEKTTTEIKNEMNQEIIPSDEPIPELPKTGIQFQSVWKELIIAKKYTYLKAINEMTIQQIDKIFASCLDMELISEIFKIFKECFVKNKWPVLNIMKSISKHDEINIFSMMLSNNDKIAINTILDYMRLDGIGNDDLTFIKNKLEV